MNAPKSRPDCLTRMLPQHHRGVQRQHALTLTTESYADLGLCRAKPARAAGLWGNQFRKLLGSAPFAGCSAAVGPTHPQAGVGRTAK